MPCVLSPVHSPFGAVMEFFLHHLSHLLELFLFHFGRLGYFIITQIEPIPSNKPAPNIQADRKLEEVATTCESCNKPNIVCRGESRDDAELVMETLGLWDSDEVESGLLGKCRNCKLMDAAYNLLEEKEASLEELEAAFKVFDENDDGQISAEELRSMMRRLGFEEGMRLEDCKRMIEAYDEDGDGKVSFGEFKNMLECTS